MQISSSDRVAIQRLTALWALSECGLGGILHAFKSPLTGVFVGGIAIVIISMILHISKNSYKTLSTSLFIVLIIKMGVSPHSGVSAYLAVGFQAIIAWCLFAVITNKLMATLLFSIIAILESAFQKLIVLTIIFGKSLWEATDQFVLWIGQKFDLLSSISGSKIIISIYLGFHLLAGIIIGLYSHSTLKRLDEIDPKKYNLNLNIKLKKRYQNIKMKGKKNLLIFSFILFGLILYFFLFTNSQNAGILAIKLILRTLVVLLIYFLIIGPLILKLMNRFLLKKKEKLTTQIEESFSLFPYLIEIVKISWSESKPKNILYRINDFLTKCIFYSIHFKIVNDDHSDR